MIRRAVIVGGQGAVGRLFTERLLGSGIQIVVVDPAGAGTPAPGGARRIHGDITDVSPQLARELGKADMVVLAVPEPVALAAVKGVAAALRPGALLVDTLSVKQRVDEEFRAHLHGVEAVGLNPMFAPALGFEGRVVAASVAFDGPLTAELLKLVESWGGRIVRVEAAEHDRLTAVSQALTHATVLSFGLALSKMGTDVEEVARIAPPPHKTLASLLARVSSGTPEVYWDVQAANPQAVDARSALAEAARRLADTVKDGSEEDFAALMGKVRGALGAELDNYRELCARIFANV
ncbi:prephenate dehydrogenase [Streptomyces sp. WAC06614]|uniref:prephenate dehydrogenase n=1 Tax=Streptomyces sp. WAC06614 TaxID=2487416 RepID=UPI000F7948F5|nr:prephenate dehydrogenase [Streptomyces sp. WAC06614]RSS80768.1 prephenate dehydrogenase [Streptomyces sp. WAC06614]